MMIKITSDELARLIRASAKHGNVYTTLGTGGVGMLDAEKTPWAVPLIQEWRGVTVSNGAGI